MKHMILQGTLLYLSALGKRINLQRKKYLGYDLVGTYKYVARELCRN